MTRNPVIVVHDLIHAETALRAAAAVSVPVTLASARFCASALGAPAFLSMIAQAAAMVPDAEYDLFVDCGDAGGHALSAIRAGAPAIAFDPDAPAFDRIGSLADQEGIDVFSTATYETALDLDAVGEPYEACHTYLQENALERQE